ncbi:MAG: metallophosphoesterase, partial [Myxococcota bacterium]
PVTAWAIRQGVALPQVKRMEIELDRWPAGLDGLRVVQISDVHFSAIRGSGLARFLAHRVNDLDPDLIAVTGDLVDGNVETLGPELEPLASMRARLGVYFVTGNHDHYSGPDAWLARFRELGMQVLRNEHRLIDAGEGVFVIAGVDDHNAGRLPGSYGEDLEAAVAGVPEGCPVLLLAHDPATFRAAQHLPVDLQLSGHTHGGQIWPFEYLVRLAVPFVAGLYRRGPATLYVSRGTGFWGPPMRLRAPSEITEIRLRSAPGH